MAAVGNAREISTRTRRGNVPWRQHKRGAGLSSSTALFNDKDAVVSYVWSVYDGDGRYHRPQTPSESLKRKTAKEKEKKKFKKTKQLVDAKSRKNRQRCKNLGLLRVSVGMDVQA